jgi:hypothetical protein
MGWCLFMCIIHKLVTRHTFKIQIGKGVWYLEAINFDKIIFMCRSF